MNRILKFMILLTGLVSFIGCQKELTFTDSPVIPGVDDSTLLTKYYQLDSTSASQIDTGIFAHFFYDNSKRLSKIIITSSSDTAINNDFYESDNFYYQNNDTLPYKLILYAALGGSPIETATTFYTYNANGKITRDSSVYDLGGGTPDIQVTRYEYAGHTVAVTRQPDDVDSITQIFQNGNLVSQHSTNYAGGSSTVSDFTYTFDAHPNPFYLPALYGTKAVGEYDDTFPAILQKNNCTSLNQTAGNQTRSIQGTYIYKQNGYPSLVYMAYHNNAPGSVTEYSKGVFVYGR